MKKTLALVGLGAATLFFGPWLVAHSAMFIIGLYSRLGM